MKTRLNIPKIYFRISIILVGAFSLLFILSVLQSSMDLFYFQSLGNILYFTLLGLLFLFPLSFVVGLFLLYIFRGDIRGRKYILRGIFLNFLLTVLMFIGTLTSYAQQVNFTQDFLNLNQQRPFLSIFKTHSQTKMSEAWSLVNKNNPTLNTVRIGIIDSGIDFSDGKHPEFQGVTIDALSFKLLKDSREEGHGTQVAGIIGANNISSPNPNNYIFPQMNGILSGIHDLSYGLELGQAPLKFLSIFGLSSTVSALTKKQVEIINMSFGSSVPLLGDLVTPIYFRIFSKNPNTLFVSGAGNFEFDFLGINIQGVNAELVAPANLGDNFGNAITVGATDISLPALEDTRLSFSNFGSAVNIAAPGVLFYSAAPRGKGNFPGNVSQEDRDYDNSFGGTSASAPMVTGVAGILKALEPEYQKTSSTLVMNPATIKETLVASADPIDTGEPDKPIGKDCFNFVSGTHTGCRLNAHRAVAWWFPPAAVQLNQPTVALAQPQTLSLSSPPTPLSIPEPELEGPKGIAGGTGAHFEITDSDYLNVTLDSSEEITVVLRSIPKMVSIAIKPSLSATSTHFVLGGLEPNTTYFKFNDSYKNEAQIVTDQNGAYTFTQDLTDPHYVWFQEIGGGTLFLPNECSTVGNLIGSTCVLTQDINETVELTSNVNIDCNNHRIVSPVRPFGIIAVGKSGIAIKNCQISDVGVGITFLFMSDSLILDNTISGSIIGLSITYGLNNQVQNNDISLTTNEGISIIRSSGNEIKGNLVELSNVGVIIFSSSNNLVQDNNIQNNFITPFYQSTGLFIASSSDTEVRGNQLNNNGVGAYITRSATGNIFQNNVINSNEMFGMVVNLSSNTNVINNTFNANPRDIVIKRDSNQNHFLENTFHANVSLYNSSFNQLFHNNFIGSTASVSGGAGNQFDNGLIDSGNFWSNFDTPAEGCSDTNADGICDAPFIFFGGQDNFPWTTQDGWEGPQAVDVELSWSENEDPDFVSYKIFRNTTGNITTSDTLIATINNQNITAFIDEDIDTGQTYHYKVFTFDGAGLSSGSNEESITL